MIARVLTILAILFLANPASARMPPRGTNAIAPELVAEGPVQAGQSVDIAIIMHTSKGWHGYWRNPGDAGLPMQVDWRLPKGVAISDLRYPVPTRLLVAGLVNYVYDKDYVLLTRLTAPAGAVGRVPIRAHARWLACTDSVCVPEEGDLALDVAVDGGAPTDRGRFDQWRRLLPRPLAASAHFALTGKQLAVAIPLPASVTIGQPYVFPIDDGVVDYAAPQSFRRIGNTLVADLVRGRGAASRVGGVLALGDGRGLEFSAVPGPVPDGGRRVGAIDASAILLAILGALAGGVLLNLMPCVFPILALKALHLARSGGDESAARRDALGYALGAIVGTGALGLLLLAIRAGGSSAGWAFQLQDPRTTILLMLLAATIAFNLAGAFVLPTLGGDARPASSFSTGALAAFVATPCAGPFLGAALGTALLLPAMGSLAVFAALGLGLALPFVLVAFVPALRHRLPRPGPWMVRLQRFLAIPMAATTAGCLWLLYRQSGPQGLLTGIGTVVILLSILLWVGWRQRRGDASGAIALVASAAVLVAAVLLVPQRASNAASAVAGARPWSRAAVAATLAKSQPAFVYFTADWCLTCKANEAAAIDRDEVRKAFRDGKVAVFAGDWTNGDPAITRFLESRGRAGVPLYLWYRPDGRIEELPQILTPAMLSARAQAR